MRTDSDFARPSAACDAGDIRGGALAALITDCFDTDEFRDSDGDPTAGGPAFFNRPEDGPASFGILNDPPIAPMSGGLDTVRFRARVALLTDSLTVSLAYPFSVSNAIRDGRGACTEPRFVRLLSLATSSSSSAFFAGDDEPPRIRYACDGASSSELSRCTAAMFCSVRVRQRAFFDGDPFGESMSEREPPTWNSAAKLPSTPRRFVGDSLRIVYEPVALPSLVFGWRRENEWWREGVDFALPLLKRRFSCTSNWTHSGFSFSSSLLPLSSTIVAGCAAPFGTVYSEMECAGGIWRVYGCGDIERGRGEAERHVESMGLLGGELWPTCDAD